MTNEYAMVGRYKFANDIQKLMIGNTDKTSSVPTTKRCNGTMAGINSVSAQAGRKMKNILPKISVADSRSVYVVSESKSVSAASAINAYVRFFILVSPHTALRRVCQF